MKSSSTTRYAQLLAPFHQTRTGVPWVVRRRRHKVLDRGCSMCAVKYHEIWDALVQKLFVDVWASVVVWRIAWLPKRTCRNLARSYCKVVTKRSELTVLQNLCVDYVLTVSNDSHHFPHAATTWSVGWHYSHITCDRLLMLLQIRRKNVFIRCVRSEWTSWVVNEHPEAIHLFSIWPMALTFQRG